jgi:hypothetical protein
VCGIELLRFVVLNCFALCVALSVVSFFLILLFSILVRSRFMIFYGLISC